VHQCVLMLLVTESSKKACCNSRWPDIHAHYSPPLMAPAYSASVHVFLLCSW
jgi:hypothetical protein